MTLWCTLTFDLFQMWDKRYSESHMVVYSAHFGPVYCCAWHPEKDNQILTGGRDKNLKVAIDTTTLHGFTKCCSM